MVNAPMTFDLIAVVFAAIAVLDAWFRGSIFAGWLGLFQAKLDSANPTPELGGELAPAAQEDLPAELPLTGLAAIVDHHCPLWLAELVSCELCFSYHVPWILLLVLYVPATTLPEPWSLLPRGVLYSLAITGLVHVIHHPE